MPHETRKVKQEGLLSANFQLDTRTLDEDARTVELSFSSESNEIEQWAGIVILDHGKKSVRLDRLNRQAPLLWMHRWDEQLGVIESVSLEKGKGRAVVRFGNSALAEEKFNDVKDGILVNVSVGFRVHKMVLEESNDESPNIYRAVDWEPYEISMVTVPADTSVGVGRHAGETFDVEIEERTMPKEKKDEAAPEENTSVQPENNQQRSSADIRVIETRGGDAEHARVNSILELGARYASRGGMDLAREHVADKTKTVEDFQRALLDSLPKEDEVGSGERSADLDLTSKDLKNYSLLRALNAAASGNWKTAGFERELSDALADQLGTEARGFYVPQQILLRAMNATNASDLIANEHMGEMFVEALRPNAVTMMLGATVLEGLQGNVEIPRELGTPTFTWIGDDEDGNENDPAMGMIKLSPHTISGGVPMSRRLLKQSSPSVEMVIQKALLKGAALGIDKGALMGSGSGNEPRGILNVTGINTQTVSSAGAPTWAEARGFKSKVAADNAAMGKLAYVTTSDVVGNMETTAKDTGSGIFIMEDGKVGGNQVAESNQLAANTIIFGNFEDLFIGLWGVMDVMPDHATKAKSGGLVLRVFQDADIAVGHAESFCKNA